MIPLRLACILLLWWGAHSSQAAVNSPLGGYCRVGKYLPLQTDAPMPAFRFDFPGAVPVFGASLESGAVVPLLIIDVPQSNLPNLTLKPLEPDQRLVGFSNSPDLPFANAFFPDDRVIAIPVDSLDGPAVTYNALDALILEKPFPSMQQIESLWIAGVSIGVRGTEKPDANLPWEQTPWGWRLDARWAGPSRGGENPQALACVEGWTPQYPPIHRKKIALLGAIASLTLLGAALLPGRWKLPGLLCAGAILSLAFIAWGKQIDPLCVQCAQIRTPLGQHDQWRFYAAIKPTDFTLPWKNSMLPMGAVSSLSLECDNKGAPVQWKVSLKPNEKLAMLSRTLNQNENKPAQATLPEFSRVSRLVKRSYLSAGGWQVQCFVPGNDETQWGTVLLEKAE